MTKCAKQHDNAEESYTWYRTGAHIEEEWDYCSLQVHKELDQETWLCRTHLEDKGR